MQICQSQNQCIFVPMKSIQELQQLFNQYLEKQPFEKQPAELYEPFRYILSLGGKRMRPTMVLLGCELFSHDAQQSLSQAMAVELFHNFSLIHDDIMDNAPKRRGQPTVHEKFNHNIAILSGDIMLVYAYEFLISNAGNKMESLLRLFNKTAIEVCEGQQWDMNFERINDVTVEQYLKMIELKTAVLLGCALKIGALIGNANEEDAERIYEVGKKLGIAFQLQDDILDSFGDEKKFGKLSGGDIIQNKKTLLLIEAMEKTNPAQRKQLLDWMAKKEFDPKEKVKAVMDLYYELNIRAIAEKEMMKYFKDAMLTLDAIDIPEMSKTGLRQFAEALIVREN